MPEILPLTAQPEVLVPTPGSALYERLVWAHWELQPGGYFRAKDTELLPPHEVPAPNFASSLTTLEAQAVDSRVDPERRDKALSYTLMAYGALRERVRIHGDPAEKKAAVDHRVAVQRLLLPHLDIVFDSLRSNRNVDLGRLSLVMGLAKPANMRRRHDLIQESDRFDPGLPYNSFKRCVAFARSALRDHLLKVMPELYESTQDTLTPQIPIPDETSPVLMAIAAAQWVRMTDYRAPAHILAARGRYMERVQRGISEQRHKRFPGRIQNTINWILNQRYPASA